MEKTVEICRHVDEYDASQNEEFSDIIQITFIHFSRFSLSKMLNITVGKFIVVANSFSTKRISDRVLTLATVERCK